MCEEPTRPGFWARVAAHVPGKSAADCFNRLYDAVPTPAPPAAAARRAAAAAAAPLQPPALTTASGAPRHARPSSRALVRRVRHSQGHAMSTQSCGPAQRSDRAGCVQSGAPPAACAPGNWGSAAALCFGARLLGQAACAAASPPIAPGPCN